MLIRIQMNVTRTAHERKLNITVKVLWVESICDNPEILASNLRNKLNNPDYKGVDAEQALEDFRKRIAQYEKVYATVDADSFTTEKAHNAHEEQPDDRKIAHPEEDDRRDESSYSYIKIFDAGERTVTNNIQG